VTVLVERDAELRAREGALARLHAGQSGVTVLDAGAGVGKTALLKHVRRLVVDRGCTEFRLGLTERGLTYTLALSPTATAHLAEAIPVTPAWTGTGRPPQPRYPDPAQNLKSLVMTAGRSAGRYVVWRHGSRKTPGNPTASMRSRFLALRVRPANRNIPRGSDKSLPACWLPAEWPPGEPEPTDYWLSTLPADTKLRDLVRLAKIRWRIEHD
jgi:SRSO17 transposase